MKYTKKQRHEIYKLAYKSEELAGYRPYLCKCIKEAIVKSKYERINGDIYYLFPELLMMRPVHDPVFFINSKDEPKISGNPKQYNAVKETILEFCIEMTK